jgi:glycerol-1-phosphate dehydrogenase [NAD(P)+]
MQHHTHEGIAPSHGFKVGIGTLASIALYEELLRRDLRSIDIDLAVASWPSLDTLRKEIADLFGPGDLADIAFQETEAKYLPPAEISKQLLRLRGVWPDLREKLQRHLLPFGVVRSMLKAAECPTDPEQIGISRSRLRQSYRQALFIRRRFTVLDLAHRAMRFEACLQSLFGPEGAWCE